MESFSLKMSLQDKILNRKLKKKEKQKLKIIEERKKVEPAKGKIFSHILYYILFYSKSQNHLKISTTINELSMSFGNWCSIRAHYCSFGVVILSDFVSLEMEAVTDQMF